MRAEKLAPKSKSALSKALQPALKDERENQRLNPPIVAGTHQPLGNPNVAAAHAAVVHRTASSSYMQKSGTIMQLQRQYGNRHVQRVLEICRQASGDSAVSSDVERAITGARGSGQSLNSGARVQMEPAFGADFSGVRVHTGHDANTLNQSLGARAFTTGKDIFFARGEYDPGSSKGQELLAHELTHVVQQNGSSVRTKLNVSQPGDPYERQADQVAQEVMQNKEVARQVPEEEDDTMQLKRLPGVDANVFR